MKILSQNEVYAKKNNERKFDLDEGLKIAKRIDEVRNTLQAESMALEKFRGETTKLVQAEIAALIKERDTLSYENSVLNRQNQDLKRPFDEEWERIRSTRLDELDKKLLDTDEKESSLKMKESTLIAREASIRSSEDEILEDKKRIREALDEANHKYEDAEKTLNEAKIHEAHLQSEIDARNQEVSRKEGEIEVKSRDLEIREDALKRSVQELARRERFINDKYLTLLRTQEHLKK